MLLQDLQKQQQQGGEEQSEQRLRRLGSVFASHLQVAESSVRAQRDSSGLLLQRGAPDLFNACWAAVATPLPSGGMTPPRGLPQQQIGSHERALAAAANRESNAPGMSWRRWAFGGPVPQAPFSAAAASHVPAANSSRAAAGEDAGAGGEIGAADVEVGDLGDMWGHLPEEQDHEQQEQEHHNDDEQQRDLLLEQQEPLLEGLQGRHKAARRKGVSWLTAIAFCED